MFEEGTQITTIPSAMFSGCSSLESFDIPTSITKIADYAFRGCALSEITIPRAVIEIHMYAFRDCDALVSVVFERSRSEWRVTQSAASMSGTYITISDGATNAEYLTYTYCRYYWRLT